MYLSKNTLPARLVRSLRISKHLSNSPTAPIQIPPYSDRDVSQGANKILPSIVEAEESTSDLCFINDFEEISRDEILDDPVDFKTEQTRILPSRCKAFPDISSPYSLATPVSEHRHRPGRSKSVSSSSPQVSRSFSRSSLRTLRRRESTKSFRPAPAFSSASKESAGSLLHDFPKPPTHIPVSTSPTQLIEPSPVDDKSSAVPFETKDLHVRAVDPNTLPPSPPSTRASSPSTIAPSESRSTVFKRFASLRSSLLPRRPRLSQIAKPSCTDSSPETPQQKVDLQLLPDFVPEPFDLSYNFDEDSSSFHFEDLTVSTSQPPIITVQEESQCTPVAAPKEPSCPQHLAVLSLKYECVDPLELTRSPSIYTTPELYSLSATPLPSSPAWLSRNIQGIENPQVDNSFHTASLGDSFPTPSSPAPLIVPPPIPVGYVLPPSLRIVADEDFPRSHNRRPPSYRSRQSTLTHRSTSYSSVQHHSGVWKSRSPTVVANSPSSFLRRSRSFSPDSTPYTQDQLLLVDSLPKTSSAPDLLSRSTDPSSLLPPIDLFDSHQPPRPSVNLQPQNSIPSHEFFVPVQTETEDPLRFPQHILHTVITALLQEASYFSAEFARMSFNHLGKPTETVDYGEEVDYSAYEWFKDPPPPRHAHNSPPVEPFVPQAGVIKQNEMFDFALKCAPNVLYAQYKKYGQLGVLGWCSEFSEMIDALKALGFEGNMFVATRTQALKTCEEILQLNIDIKMQIIVMYLSSQVARLRRFLDGDRQWDDYPIPSFPSFPHPTSS